MDTFIKRMLILLLITASFLPVMVSGASSELYTNALYAGQNKMYNVNIPCTATILLSGPVGTELFLYAKKADSSWIPSDGYVMNYPDVSSTEPGSSQKLSLDSGNWFIVAHSQEGFGEYTMSVDKSCPMGTSCIGTPCTNMEDCIIPKASSEDVQTGFIRTGESKTYAYTMPKNRSYVEWVLNGPCDFDVPQIKTKAELDRFTTKNCGADFDLYIYKSCNPKYYPCKAVAADTGAGSNAYIGVVEPESDTLYYVKIFAKHGRGDYQLTARSYSESNITIAGIQTGEYSGFVAPQTDVNAPDDLDTPIPVPPTAYTVRSVEI
jgi:hypothetical protein